MQCPTCATPVSDAALFCPSCGHKLGDAAPAASVPVPLKTTSALNQDGYDWLTTLLLCIFLGHIGVHRFYTGHTTIGILMLFTGGCCGIMTLYDIIIIVTDSYKDIQGRPLIRKQ